MGHAPPHNTGGRHEELNPRPRQQLSVRAGLQHTRHCHRPRFGLDLYRPVIRHGSWRRLKLQVKDARHDQLSLLPIQRSGDRTD